MGRLSRRRYERPPRSLRAQVSQQRSVNQASLSVVLCSCGEACPLGSYLALIVVAVTAVCVPAAAQVPVAEMSAIPIREGVLPIVLDGDLSDPAWAQATPIISFLQRDPLEGAPATMRTEARVAFDATAIYVAVRAFDPDPDRIVGFLTRRDAESSSDWVHVLIDSYHDRRTAYQFGVNPVGVKQDYLLVQRLEQRRQLGRRVGRRVAAGQ